MFCFVYRNGNEPEFGVISDLLEANGIQVGAVDAGTRPDLIIILPTAPKQRFMQAGFWVARGVSVAFYTRIGSQRKAKVALELGVKCCSTMTQLARWVADHGGMTPTAVRAQDDDTLPVKLRDVIRRGQVKPA